jgi:hypothetical protein
MTRVLIGDALVNEDQRLQARINQLHDRLEATLKQALRFAMSEKQIPDTTDTAAQANLMIAFVIGRWHQFAKADSSVIPPSNGLLNGPLWSRVWDSKRHSHGQGCGVRMHRYVSWRLRHLGRRLCKVVVGTWGSREVAPDDVIVETQFTLLPGGRINWQGELRIWCLLIFICPIVPITKSGTAAWFTTSRRAANGRCEMATCTPKSNRRHCPA